MHPTRPGRVWNLRGVALALLLALGAVHGADAAKAPKPTERSKQKAAAETERAALARKLANLKAEIGKTESAKEDAADTLAESEEAISDANRTLRDLAAEQSQINSKVAELAAEQLRLSATVAAQKQQLAKLLREQYVAGNEDRIKLLLSGDNPNRINRELQLMAYVSQSQARLLDSLRANLKKVEENQAEAQNAKQELDEIAEEEKQQKAKLEQEKGRRAAALASLSKKLVAQRKEAGRMEQDAQRLDALVDKLNKLIEEQARIAAAEKARQEKLAAERAAKAKAEAEARALARAKAQAERERLAQEAKKAGKPVPKPPPVEDEPKVAAKPEPSEQRDEKSPRPSEVALAPVVPDGVFARLKGELPAPVAGKVDKRFGSKNADGVAWKGMVVKAAAGAEVRAVAAGRVVYATSLRGYGNFIIIDHGGQYWSGYGYNESVLKRAGDVVKAGEVIATVGNTGGYEESGLYFEMRHQGKPIDPAGWVKF
ncbi:murein hydrolase activator EnvC family protein [Pseudoduganella sp. R-34]|uniref:murein hydrolase activator EnvC family protein n=1 Tax=unclassified Pseudoduganella TaxID=2637179 RepID=UPI003CE69EC2